MSAYRIGAAIALLGAVLTASLPATAAISVSYTHTDLQGSVVAMSNEAGEVTQRRDYEPYGLPSSAIDREPGYTGHVHDADSGLVYMQQRYYDAETGRFLSVDPVYVSSSNGANFNRYWYANNNPYKYVDPDGEFAKLAAGFLAGAVVGAGVEIYSQVREGNGIDTKKVRKQALKGGVIGLSATLGGATAAALQSTKVATAAMASGYGLVAAMASNLVDMSATGEAVSFEDFAVDSMAEGIGAGIGALFKGPASSVIASGGTEVLIKDAIKPDGEGVPQEHSENSKNIPDRDELP